jgi:DNA-binding PadR family transcriptional regulator
MLMSFCSNQKLTKENALEILKKDFKKKCYQGLISHNTYYYGNYYQEIDKYQKNSLAEIQNVLMDLRKQGYISDIQDKERKIRFTLTSSGKRFQSSKKDRIGKLFEVATSEVVEVLGISENKNTGRAVIKFRYTYTPSPFYNLRRYKDKYTQKDNCANTSYEEEIEFRKFDDRWEIKK